MNADPTGRYYLAASFTGGSPEYVAASAALQKLRDNERCKCAFKVVHGRVPYSDPFPISLGTSVTYVDPTNYEPYQPEGRAIFVGDPACGPACTGRIELGNLPFQFDTDELARTMAHEMTHLSFNLRGHFELGEKNPENMEDAYNGDFSDFSPDHQKKIEKCMCK